MSWDLSQELDFVVHAVVATVIAAGALQNLLYLVQLWLAGRELATKPPEPRSRLLWRRYSEVAPPIALLVPAYNEEQSIADSVRSLLALNYPHFEVIAVNDGSRDRTLAALIEAFDLQPVSRAYELSVKHKPVRGLYGSPAHPRLLVVDKDNGGKSDALNAGINISRAPLFCAIDADSILERDSLLRAVKPFVDDPARTAAVGGTVRVANGCTVRNGRVREIRPPRNLLALFQTVEYLRAFLMVRVGWSKLGVLTIISGAFGLFRRALVVEVGGYSHGTVGEDFELVLKLHRHLRDKGADYAITFMPEPVCWTEAPERLRDLARQRSRWQRGALEAFSRHSDMLFRRRYGRVGALGLGYVLLIDVIGPVVEVLGYLLVPLLWAMGLLSFEYFLAYVALTFVLGVFVSVGAVALEEIELRRFGSARDLLVIGVAAILENFGYRQLSNVWRLKGYWQFLRKEQGWGAMARVGFRNA